MTPRPAVDDRTGLAGARALQVAASASRTPAGAGRVALLVAASATRASARLGRAALLVAVSATRSSARMGRVALLVAASATRASARAGRVALLVAASATAFLANGCKGQTPTLQGAMDDLATSLRDLLGTETLPGKHVAEIYAIHEDDRSWRFRIDVEKPLERCREAVRGLATADYGSWREAAVVTRLLTAIADQHPSSLVRAEALDTLARMSPWTNAANAAPPRRATEEEAAQATDRILAARKRAAAALEGGGSGGTEPADPSGDLADALDTIAAYRFDVAKSLPEKIDVRILARESRHALVTTGKVLRALTGGALEGFDADPRVREALDRALVATSAGAIRLALIAGATGGVDETVRAAAVRDLEIARPEKAARILGVILATDDSATVRREAARALGSFPWEESAAELIPALADDRSDVRAAAAASLTASTGESHGDDRVAWTRWWAARTAAAAPPDAPAKDGPAPVPPELRPR